MKEWVDIEGSGEQVTKITGQLTTGWPEPSNACGYAAVMMGANNAEVRFLSIENTGGSGNTIAFRNHGTSPTITHATLTSVGAAFRVVGICNESGSSPRMTDVTVTAVGTAASLTATGLANYAACSPSLKNVTITALSAQRNHALIVENSTAVLDAATIYAGPKGGDLSTGILLQNSGQVVVANSNVAGDDAIYVVNWGSENSAAIDRSTVQGVDKAVTLEGAAGTVRIGASKVVGAVDAPTVCVGAYDGNYNALSATCQ
jgi:hypothetical protein